MIPILTLHDPAQTIRHYAEGVWRHDTLYILARQHASATPFSYALRDGRRRLTYMELLGWTDAVAQYLRNLGLHPGQRVSVWLPNRIESVVVQLACARNGYVCNPSLHQNYTVAEIAGLLRRLGTSVLVTQNGYGADATRHDISEFSAEIPSLKHIVRLPSLEDSGTDSGGFPTIGPASGTNEPLTGHADQIVYVAFTSGTTGIPKGVMHSNNTMLANARAMVSDWGHTSETVILSLSPLSHHIAAVGMAQALVAGSEFVVNAPPPKMSTLEWIETTGATYVLGVPTHAIDLLIQLELTGKERLGRVQVFYMAGSPIPVETAQRFVRLGIKPQNVYGMSENSSHNYTLPRDDISTITETCGRPCKGYEIRIFDQGNPDTEVPAGEIGEIGGRGGVLMLGYWGDQVATEASFNAEGWFMSGDLGILDAQGCLRIVGRKKDLIIRGGHNIHPARIEDLAMRHGSVQKAAAFPVPDTRLGEKVCLAVIAAPGLTLTGATMFSHLESAGLSKYDMPEYFIQLETFPLTPSGKVLKRELVEWAKAGRIRPELMH
jgi:acyl-CoA synthetase